MSIGPSEMKTCKENSRKPQEMITPKACDPAVSEELAVDDELIVKKFCVFFVFVFRCIPVYNNHLITKKRSNAVVSLLRIYRPSVYHFKMG